LTATTLHLNMADVLKETLKIAFIPGTGNMGKSLARNHAKAGWHVLIGSRSKDKYDLLLLIFIYIK
jgi:NADP-dependent 3-hydroxy acid dehydrogenase YdfG